MRIGIDIDNTLTDIKKQLDNAVYEYAKSINKSVTNKNIDIIDTNNNGNIYQKMFNFSYEELKYFLGPIQEKITNNAAPRPYCVDIVNQLHSQGNEIYIITARDSEFHDDPYLQSEIWLKTHNIYFDKLIVNARDKKKVCLENSIDLLIDDSISNCLNVSSAGIQTLMIGNDKEIVNGIRNFDNWQQIFNFINKNKIVKIISYNDKYKKEVCNFINESMHKFIGRPYKERKDVSNIDEYYIKNNGNFWLAIDVKSQKIVGTIALENRKNKYSILKRFYVDENYQSNGLGTRLYNIFEIYIKENTKIDKVYLTCGNVLKKAHSFYESKGFIQQDSIDIDMHFADDDDFFIKDIDRN